MNVLRYNCRYMIKQSGVPRTTFCRIMNIDDNIVGVFINDENVLKITRVETCKPARMTAFFVKHVLERDPYRELKISGAVIFERLMKFSAVSNIASYNHMGNE